MPVKAPRALLTPLQKRILAKTTTAKGKHSLGFARAHNILTETRKLDSLGHLQSAGFERKNRLAIIGHNSAERKVIKDLKKTERPEIFEQIINSKIIEHRTLTRDKRKEIEFKRRIDASFKIARIGITTDKVCEKLHEIIDSWYKLWGHQQVNQHDFNIKNNVKKSERSYPIKEFRSKFETDLMHLYLEKISSRQTYGFTFQDNLTLLKQNCKNILQESYNKYVYTDLIGVKLTDKEIAIYLNRIFTK